MATSPTSHASRSPRGSPASSSSFSTYVYTSLPATAHLRSYRGLLSSQQPRQQKPWNHDPNQGAASITTTASHESSHISNKSYLYSEPSRRISSPTPSVTSSSSSSSSSSPTAPYDLAADRMRRSSLPSSISSPAASSWSAQALAAPSPPSKGSLAEASSSNTDRSITASSGLLPSSAHQRTSSVWVNDGTATDAAAAAPTATHPPPHDVSESTTYWEDCAVVEIKPTRAPPPRSQPAARSTGPRRGSTRSPSSLTSGASPTLNFPKMALLCAVVALALMGAAVAVSSAWRRGYLGMFHPVRALENELDRVQQSYRFLLGQKDALLVQVRDAAPTRQRGSAEAGDAVDAMARQVEQLQKRVKAKSQQLVQELQTRQRHEDELFTRLREARIAREQKAEHEQQKRDATVKLLQTLAYDQFGVGPHEVEFTVRFSPAPLNSGADVANQTTDEGTFVVRVASLETAPVASFWFLQQVEHGLWDGTSFSINAPHMVLAQPVSVPPDMESRLPEMEAAGLSRLPFLATGEADPEMHRAKYALSYGSSPATAGSFFYISRRNGGGGADHGGGPSTFARVVEGHDVVDRIAALETSPIDFRLAHPVEIVSAWFVEAVDDREDEHGPSTTVDSEDATE